MRPLNFPESARHLHTRLRASLESIYASVGHPGLKGDDSEREWMQMFENSLPRRYAVRKGEIIDSKGGRSDQIDIILYDPQFTPLLFTQREAAYVPAEAVYAVFEVKPALTRDDLEYASKKAASVRRLHRTSAPVHHSDGVHPPKPPFPILAGFLAHRADAIDPTQWLPRLLGEHASVPETRLDLGCILDFGSFELDPGTPEPQVSRAEHCLMQFLFRLLHRLQVLGTVPAINWSEYAKSLSSIHNPDLAG